MSTVVKDSTAPIQNPSRGGRGVVGTQGKLGNEVFVGGLQTLTLLYTRDLISCPSLVLHTLSDFQPNIMDFPFIDVQCSKTKLSAPQICSLLMANFHTFLFQEDILFKMLNSKIVYPV